MKTILLALFFLIQACIPAYADVSFGGKVSNGTFLPGKTGFTNYIKNPYCETKTATPALVSPGTDSSYAVGTGLEGHSCDFTAGSVGDKIFWTTNTLKVGGNCEAKVTWEGNASHLKAYVADSSGTMLGSATTLSNAATFPNSIGEVSLNYQVCTNSVRIYVEVVSTSANVAKIATSYGKATNIGTVQQANFFGGIEKTKGTGCYFPETTSTSLSNFVDLGTGTNCGAWTASGGVTSVATNDHRFTINSGGAGVYKVEMIGNAFNNGTAFYCIFQLSDGTNSYQTQMVASNAASTNSPLLSWSIDTQGAALGTKTYKVQAADSGTGTCGISAEDVNLAWKVYYFPSSAQSLANVSNYAWKVDANISGANPSLGTSNVSSYTGIENGSLTLTNNSGNGNIAAQIPCSSTNAPTGTTCAAGNESVGVSFPLPQAQDVLACASFAWAGATSTSGTVETTFQVVETPNNAQTISQEGKSRIQANVGTANNANNYPFRVCGNLTFASAGQKTLRLMYEQQVSGTVSTSLVLGDTSASAGQRDIHWEVYPLNTLFGAPLLVNSVISNSSGVEKHNTATIVCSSSPSITSQSGDWITSVGILSAAITGLCKVNIKTGTCNAKPRCTMSVENTSTTTLIGELLTISSATDLSVGANFMSSGSNTVTAGSNSSINLSCDCP